jgi:Pyridoxamine 5'-phosphate oxidase
MRRDASSVWIDERGSDVLGLPECRQLLAVGAARHLPAHLAISGEEDHAPTVLPVDYAVEGPDALIRVGEGLFGNIVGKLVAFEVECPDEDRPWSVLVRGLAIEESREGMVARLPAPRVSEPGSRLVRIRSDVVTGRRLAKHAE